MSNLKKLVAVHDKYLMAFEHKIEHRNVPDVGPSTLYSVKATLTIPGEGNMYTKQVSTDFVSGSSLMDAEQNAMDLAISRLLGDKGTKKLVEEFPTFNITTSAFETRDPKAPAGCKVTITLTQGEGDPKPFRIVSGLATGADSVSAENAALKSAVNKALGIK